MPPAAALLHLPFLLQGWHHPVQIVRLDPHLAGEVADGYPGVRLHELEGLDGAGARAARPASAASRRPPRPALAGASTAAAVQAAQGVGRLLQPAVLLHERPELAHPCVDLLSFLTKKIRHPYLHRWQ